MAINLKDHRAYIDTHKMYMVPYSVAVQAVNEVISIDTVEYEKELENALTDLKRSINNINLDD